MEQKTYPTDEHVKEAHEKHIPIIDVRPKEMYEEGHIPGAINIPLSTIQDADVKDGSYLYCIIGYHAGLAQEALAKRGIHTTDIGGLDFYHGPLEK